VSRQSRKEDARNKAEDLAKTALDEIRAGKFDFETNRDKLWELNGGKAFSACPGVSYNSLLKRWQLNFGIRKLNEEETGKTKLVLLRSIGIQSSTDGEFT
jgi:hypothetical protein